MNARCPRCDGGLELDSLHAGDETVGLCSGCKGLYVSGPYIRGELGGRDPGEVLGPLEVPHHEALGCPSCRVPMTPLRTLGEPEVEVDRCGRCGGYWLDRSELPAVKRVVGAVRRSLGTAAGPSLAMYEWPETFDIDANPGKMGEWLFVLLSGVPREIWIAPTRKPLWTYGIVGLCVLLAVYGLVASATESLVHAFGMVPSEVSQGRQLLTLVTSVFLHGGVLHLVGNMYFLWIFGDNVEDSMGRLWYPLFFVAGGVAAALTEVAVEPNSLHTVVGASGAVSALMGAYVVMFPQARLRVAVPFNVLEVPALFFAVFWGLLQLLFYFAGIGGVAWWAHVGGLVAGVLVGVGYRVAVLPRLRRAAE